MRKEKLFILENEYEVKNLVIDMKYSEAIVEYFRYKQQSDWVGDLDKAFSQCKKNKFLEKFIKN